jgi:hypothetical protein
VCDESSGVPDREVNVEDALIVAGAELVGIWLALALPRVLALVLKAGGDDLKVGVEVSSTTDRLARLSLPVCVAETVGVSADITSVNLSSGVASAGS